MKSNINIEKIAFFPLRSIKRTYFAQTMRSLFNCHYVSVEGVANAKSIAEKRSEKKQLNLGDFFSFKRKVIEFTHRLFDGQI